MKTAVSQDSIMVRTTALVRAIQSRNAGVQHFQAGDSLVDIGLTSLDLVNLMMAVEAEFDILIPPDQLNLQNFYSTATIARMVSTVVAPERNSAAA